MNILLIGRRPGHARYSHFLKKLYLTMKLTTLLLIISILHVSGKALSQITIQENNVKITTILKSIERQSGYVFIFNENKISLGITSVNVKNASINQALEACFRGAHIEYQIIDKNIVLRQKETVSASFENKLFAPPVLVVGRVTDAQAQPINGVSVLVKRTRKGVSTDLQGRYAIKTAEITDTLVFSYLGLQTKEISVRAALKNGPILDVSLLEATSELDGLVVQGYGKTSKRLATGNIARVSGKEISEQPVFNPILALQGRVPGVIVTPVGGTSSGPVKIEIRGRKALNTRFPSDPLYIIDGVPLTVLEVAPGAAETQGGSSVSRGLDQTGLTQGQSPFFNLNPQDIESIEILKDADATAIYGSRAANGVILITTKKGKPGKTALTFSVNRGVNFATSYFQMLNTEQYLAMRREAFANSGVTPDHSNAYDLLDFDQQRYTDWQRYRTGANSQSDYQGSISGGNELTTYRIGASFGTTNDLSAISGKNQRGTFSLALHNQTSDQRFSLDLSASYGVTYIDQLILNPSFTLAPNAPDPYDDQGNLNFAAWGAAHANYPFGNLKNTSVQKGGALKSSLKLTYNILKGLSATVSTGYNNFTNENTFIIPIAGLDPFEVRTPYGSAQFGSSKVSNVIIEPQLNYHALISKGSLTLLAGASYQGNQTSGGVVAGNNYTDDNLINSINNAPLVTATNNFARYKYAGLFARLNFIWDGRYILNLNGRRDGSSRFGSSSRYGNFYSLGGAWNLSDEPWLKGSLPAAFSLIKFRGSYGLTGSDAVGDYQYLTQWGNQPALPDYNGVSPLYPQIQPNSDYHWQVNRSAELALELGFFEDRLTFSTSLYRSYCDNQLVNFLTPAFTGFNSVVANSPAKVANDGLEFQLNWTIIDKKDFQWSTSFNTGFNRNRLLAYPDLEKSPYAGQFKIGSSVNTTYVFNYLGVDPLTGEYTFEDYNGDNKISGAGGKDSRGDRYIEIRTDPKFTGNITQMFRYKGFSLSANFYIVKQQGKNFLYNQNTAGVSNMSLERYLNRWQKPGDIALTSRVAILAGTTSAFVQDSNMGYTDASFIRLNSLNLSGSLPQKVSKALGVGNVSLGVSASNIFVITRYKGIDPVVQQFGGALPSRTISFGLNCQF